ncbi:MAG: hypothetical protein IJ604_07800 [Prevotella sp.]|nr:hypothetical protein [Prevotella sp.]
MTSNKKQENRNKKQEVFFKKQEARGKKQEARGKKQENRNKKQCADIVAWKRRDGTANQVDLRGNSN